MIDVKQALADLDATPGDLIAVPKGQMRDLLGELRRRQEAPRSALAMFGVAALATAGAAA